MTDLSCLAPVLESVETQKSQVGRFRMSVYSKNPAFFLRGCRRIKLPIWSPGFEVSARRDEVLVPTAAHGRGATPQ